MCKSEKAYRLGWIGPAIGADEAEAVKNNTRQQKPVQAAMPRNDGCATVGHNTHTGQIGRVGLFFNRRCVITDRISHIDSRIIVICGPKSKRGGIKGTMH
jgi:hypothetical protein